MKRALGMAIAGFLAAAASYCVLYHCGTKKHREMIHASAPELAWLKKEFRLSDAEFERISKLHEGYMPRCAELCQRIARKNSELEQIISSTNVDAKAVEHKLKEAGDLRVECQKNMFNHFLQVSHQMPPEQGKRYLQWVQQRTLTREHDMEGQHHGEHPTAHH
jgi:Spy/CpxP family protein refolding chaperone